MDRKIVLFILIFIILAVGIWYWSGNSQNPEPSSTATSASSKPEATINKDAEIILFYGSTCPHCKEVEKFIEDNDISSKVNFENAEVYYNESNSDILEEKALECNISEKSIGVPFLYARGECLVGSPDIEAFFKKEAGL